MELGARRRAGRSRATRVQVLAGREGARRRDDRQPRLLVRRTRRGRRASSKAAGRGRPTPVLLMEGGRALHAVQERGSWSCGDEVTVAEDMGSAGARADAVDARSRPGRALRRRMRRRRRSVPSQPGLRAAQGGRTYFPSSKATQRCSCCRMGDGQPLSNGWCLSGARDVAAGSTSLMTACELLKRSTALDAILLERRLDIVLDPDRCGPGTERRTCEMGARRGLPCVCAASLSRAADEADPCGGGSGPRSPAKASPPDGLATKRTACQKPDPHFCAGPPQGSSD